jgi:hypothetical protein
MDLNKLLELSQLWLKKLETLEIWQICALVFGAIVGLAILAAILRGIWGMLKAIFKRRPRKKTLVDSLEGSDTIIVTHQQEPDSNEVVSSKLPNPAKKRPIPQQITITNPEQAVEFVELLGGRIGKNRQEQIVLIFLNDSSLNDDQTKIFRYLRSVESLHLRRTAITDQTLEELGNLTHLKYLYISDTPVTDEGVSALQFKRPLLKIER